MKKIFHHLMCRISPSYRIHRYRQTFSVPDDYYNPLFSVEIATTQDDLKSAYTLLHNSYLGICIIDPQPSGLRCNLFSFLPTTSVVVAKWQGRVIGTVSLIKDSNSGLPSDQEFPEQNKALRNQGKSLVEISALAVAPEFRGKHAVTFLLTAFLYAHCRDYLACDEMIAAVHPKSETFYQALMNFKTNGQSLGYSSLKGAAAIHISMDLSDQHLQHLTSLFSSPLPKNNFGALLASGDKRFTPLKKKTELQISPVITPGLLKFFCLQQKEVWSRMSVADQRTLIQIYSTFFGTESMNEFRQDAELVHLDKDYRTPVYITALITREDRSTRFCRMLDLNSGGCYLVGEGLLPATKEKIEIAFRFCDRDYRLRGQVVWQNQGQADKHRPNGIGIQFEEKITNLNQDLQQWIYSVCQPPEASSKSLSNSKGKHTS